MNQQTTSLWIATAPAPEFARITGVTAAVLLKRRGRRVAILEKQRVAGAESGNTTAHITEAIDRLMPKLRGHSARTPLDKPRRRVAPRSSRSRQAT